MEPRRSGHEKDRAVASAPAEMGTGGDDGGTVSGSRSVVHCWGLSSLARLEAPAGPYTAVSAAGLTAMAAPRQAARSGAPSRAIAPCRWRCGAG